MGARRTVMMIRLPLLRRISGSDKSESFLRGEIGVSVCRTDESGALGAKYNDDKHYLSDFEPVVYAPQTL